MRISNLLSALSASALLAAAPVIAGQDPSASEWRQVAYNCETGDALTIAYSESGSSVRVTVADKRPVKLNARPAKAGFRFGDSLYELRGGADAVTWKIGSRTPVKCASTDPEAALLAAAATR